MYKKCPKILSLIFTLTSAFMLIGCSNQKSTFNINFIYSYADAWGTLSANVYMNEVTLHEYFLENMGAYHYSYSNDSIERIYMLKQSKITQ